MSFEPSDPEGKPEKRLDEEVLYIHDPYLIDEPEEIPMAESVELETSFLHPSSLVFTVIAQLRQNLIPAVIALFGAAKGNYVFIGIAAAIFVLSIVAATVRYLTLRYSIQNGELTVQSGLFFRRLRKVPTSQIQNIDLVQNILHRLFRVAEVRVETASGTEPEATLRVLSLSQVENLRAKVRSAAQRSTADSEITESTGVSATDRESTTAQEILRIPTSWLLKAGLASNRGMVLLGFMFGLYYQNLPSDGRDFRNMRDQLRGVSSYLPDMGQGWQLWLAIAGATVVLLALIRLFGIGWFILRFFGYRLSQQGDDFKISCGLFTKVSATVPIRRIQFISIHRSLIMRWFGLASIRIETAGGAGKNDENATTTVSKRWFVPVVPESQISELMSKVRPELDWTENNFDWKPLAPRAAARFIRIGIIFSIFLIVVGVAASRPWGWVPGLALSPLIVWYWLKRSRSTKYVRIGKGVIFRSGVFTRKTSITFFEKIQGASVSQSPFDRRWGMGTLSVDTAAAGPANHTISIRYLDASFAAQEYRDIVRLASKQASAV
jgi:putative membrane protein